MKNHFSSRRFGRLFTKHTVEYANQYMLSVGVLIAIMTVLMGFVSYVSPFPIAPTQQAVFFVLFLFGAGFIFTSSIFSQLGNKSQAIAMLSLPASHFEKFLVGWLYSFLIFIVVFTASFYLVDVFIISLDDWQGREKEIVNIFSADNKVYGAYLVYAFIHAVAIWGAIFFTKTHFIKTAFAFLVVMGVITALNFQVVQGLLQQDLRSAVPFGEVNFESAGELYQLELPKQQQRFLVLVPFGLAFLFWSTAYVRIKEKQI